MMVGFMSATIEIFCHVFKITKWRFTLNQRIGRNKADPRILFLLISGHDTIVAQGNIFHIA